MRLRFFFRYIYSVLFFVTAFCNASGQLNRKEKDEADYILNNISSIATSDSAAYTIRSAVDYYINSGKSSNPTDSILQSLRTIAVIRNDKNILAIYYWLMGHKRRAESMDVLCMYYDSAFVTAKAVGSKPIMYEAISGKADDLYSASRYQEALAAILESIKLAEKFGHGYQGTLPDRYIRLSAIYGALKDTLRQYNAALKSYEIAVQYGNIPIIATSAERLSNVLIKRKEYSRALELNRLLTKWTDSLGTSWKYSSSYTSLASLFLKMNVLDSAKLYALAALPYLEQNNQETPILTSSYILAQVYDEQNKPDSAIFYLQKCLSFNKSSLYANQFRRFYSLLASVYSKKGDYKNAFESILKYNALYDSIITVEKNKAMAEMSVKFETEKKDGEIQLLAQENKIQQATVERQQFIRNSLIIICIIILAFGGLLFNRFKLKKKIEKQQAIIDERQRISRELHDDLGAQLSTAKMFLHSIKNDAVIGTSTTAIENSLSLIDNTIKDLRGIMDDLQTNVLQDKGYIAATEELVSKINQLQQINFTLTHFNTEKRLDTRTEHHLFRITQELINNSLKYARAKNVSINLLKKESKVVLMYEDDGKGFSVDEVKKGNGLLNIESRCNAVGGIVEFDTEPGRGFRCNIELAVA